ncbi:phosphoenolpyruvate--protein phosphotransferase [Actinopolymorpha pittospori]|uniref:Phosphocarrier protein HPr n=1 Tax=Actinopolymorpha pittospori TaxID=648752 RepID=A0A927RK23_9ACTN|nr:phosphoenolpyruvate--protein phosphotransferase [Actinopolymorpha pittospori]MBE1606273.1 phosphocarrier protein FPr [Actinopolymorpha pittospori]
MSVGIVLVAHVPALADGVRTLAAQMAPDVPIAAAGGTDEGAVGTSFEKILGAVLAVDAGDGVAVLYDLGSAELTAELVLESLGPEQVEWIRLVDAPLVEGALAAAISSAGGADLATVVAAARSALSELAGRTAEGAAAPVEAETGPTLTATAVLRNPAGLHARPASRLAHLVSGFDARLRIGRPGQAGVDAASVLGIVAQGIRVGAEVEVVATGGEARPALDAVLALVAEGFGEFGGPPPDATAAPAEVVPDGGEPGIIGGVGASPGIAVAPVRHLHRAAPALPPARPGLDPNAERRRLNAALTQIHAALGVRAAAGGPDASIAGAHQAMLDDPALRSGAEAKIDESTPAERAWWQTVQEAAELLAGGDAYAAERAVDVEEVGRAVLAALGVDVRPSIRPDDAAGAVVVAEDLFASDVAALAEAGVAGLALAGGGRTAHAAIIARGLEVPMLVRLGRPLLDVAEGTLVVLDAISGILQVDPPPSVRSSAKERACQLAGERDRARAEAAGSVVHAEGRQVLVAANVGSLAEARAAVAAGADGVGLLRTELLYVDRPALPDEDEQTAELGAILEVLGDRPVVVRTLDVGGDKMLPALDLDPWRNGPLGVRGLRYGLAHPGVLRTQLRAILRAAGEQGAHVWVMAPMVTVAEEARQFRELLADVVAELDRQGTVHAPPAKVGVMLEVPAAALAPQDICAEVDFVSVGSNDLLQYVMAADRANDAVGYLYQPEHPALWRVLDLLVGTARAAGCHVAVCGEIAGDPEAAVRLVRLGVDELSMAPSSLPAVKAALREAYGSVS